MDFLRKIETPAYVALRFVAGFMFLFHGVQKLFGVLTTKAPPELFSQAWFGGVIELVGGAMIALGLLTRPAAFISSGTMAVAYLQFHWKGELGTQLLPIVNKGELAALYCFVFLFICLRGAGPISIDRQLGRA